MFRSGYSTRKTTFELNILIRGLDVISVMENLLKNREAAFVSVEQVIGNKVDDLQWMMDITGHLHFPPFGLFPDLCCQPLKFFHIPRHCGILGYMKKTTLLATNNYLKDRRKRDTLLRRVVLTSSAVEGVGKAAADGLKKRTVNSSARYEVSDAKQH